MQQTLCKVTSRAISMGLVWVFEYIIQRTSKIQYQLMLLKIHPKSPVPHGKCFIVEVVLVFK